MTSYESDALTIAYQSGYYDGKKAAQPAQEHCQCPACKDGKLHWSDCAVHSEPAYPAGPCDCGVTNPRLGGVLAQPTSSDYALGYAEGFNDACKKPEPKSVTYKEVQDSMNAMTKGTIGQRIAAEDLGQLKLYTTPPQRAWVGLDDDELTEAWHWGGCDPHIEGAHFKALYQYFEAKLKDKNHVAQKTD